MPLSRALTLALHHQLWQLRHQLILRQVHFADRFWLRVSLAGIGGFSGENSQTGPVFPDNAQVASILRILLEQLQLYSSVMEIPETMAGGSFGAESGKDFSNDQDEVLVLINGERLSYWLQSQTALEALQSLLVDSRHSSNHGVGRL